MGSRSKATKNREGHLKRAYGLTQVQFLKILRKQSGSCGICGSRADHWAIDHCHVTKEVRGVLCRSCNTGLGLFKDNPVILMNAIRYLRRAFEKLILIFVIVSIYTLMGVSVSNAQSYKDVTLALHRIGLIPGAVASIGLRTFMLDRMWLTHPKKGIWRITLRVFPVRVTVPKMDYDHRRSGIHGHAVAHSHRA